MLLTIFDRKKYRLLINLQIHLKYIFKIHFKKFFPKHNNEYVNYRQNIL